MMAEIEIDTSLLVAVSMENYSDECNPEENDSNLVYCSICHVNFFDASEYEIHNAEVHGPCTSESANITKKYPCLHCKSSFRRHDHLKRHINSVHSSGAKSHKCPICEDVFTRKDVLLKHVRKKHADAQSFQCRECPYNCESLQDLESHNSIHLLQDAHICSFCKKPFKRRDHMLRHIKTLHLNQYTVCPVCCQQFKRKDHVRRHCREKHRMEFQNGKIIKLQDKGGNVDNGKKKA